MKKSLILILVSVVILSLSMFTFADETQCVDSEILEAVQIEVDDTNKEIDKLIKEYVKYADEEEAYYEKEVDYANKTLTGDELQFEIDALLIERNANINAIIQELIDVTNAVAFEMFQSAAEQGVTVICELVPVEIGGQTVMIDPIRIIGS